MSMRNMKKLRGDVNALAYEIGYNDNLIDIPEYDRAHEIIDRGYLSDFDIDFSIKELETQINKDIEDFRKVLSY